MNRVFIASLSAVSLILAANETFARTGTAPGGGAALAHPVLRPLVARSLHHHRGNNLGAFWPGADDQSYAPSNVEPNMGVAAPVSGEMHYTYTDDVPWDAVHRFPPAVTPSARPYVQECTAETVTVPRHGGAEQTASVNIMRCY
jgi:hypothetical protein